MSVPTVAELLTPSRADYRLVRRLVSMLYGDAVRGTPDEYDRIVRVYARAGGCWQRLYGGSSAEFALLKRVIRTAYRLRLLTLAPQWK